MKRILVLLALVASMLQLTGCTNFQVRTHANPCEGIGVDLDASLLGEGQAYEECRMYGQGGRPGGYGGGNLRRPPPGQAALSIMQSTEGLAQWASQNGQAPVQKYHNCNVSEFAGMAQYGCSAGHSSHSVTIGGQVVLQHERGYGGRGYGFQTIPRTDMPQHGNNGGGYDPRFR